jgi:hypothetical protein
VGTEAAIVFARRQPGKTLPMPQAPPRLFAVFGVYFNLLDLQGLGSFGHIDGEANRASRSTFDGLAD